MLTREAAKSNMGLPAWSLQSRLTVFRLSAEFRHRVHPAILHAGRGQKGCETARQKVSGQFSIQSDNQFLDDEHHDDHDDQHHQAVQDSLEANAFAKGKRQGFQDYEL